MMTAHLLDEYDVATRLGLSITKINRLIRDEAIPFVRLPGGEVRFDDDDLAVWEDSLKQQERNRKRQCEQEETTTGTTHAQTAC